MLVNWRPSALFFIFYFKGTPLQEEHETIFSGLQIHEMALPDQIGFPAFSISRRLHTKNFINSTV
jgi:hypothetical protein